MNSELKQIKKLYGEDMMHLCRRLFPTVLETEGVLLETLTRVLAPTSRLSLLLKKYDYFDYESDFARWINDCVSKNNKQEEIVKSTKTPEELMDEAGYTLYECQSESDIQRFKKYYAPGEELCTFNGGRLNRCYVFFAVKKNVDKIKREDFPNPKREDEYGTSVISIQFARNETHSLSIKNRYNHTVSNPDATFSNNLDNIIPGLTESFARKYHFYQKPTSMKERFLTVLHYIRDAKDRYYYYYKEVNAVYYCENNVIIKDGIVIDTYSKDKSRYLVIDQYIIDMQDKNIFSLSFTEDDAFIKSIKDVGDIKNFNIIKNDEGKTIEINYMQGEKVTIGINGNNEIISYENNHVKTIGDKFLAINGAVKSVSLQGVKTIGNKFMIGNTILKEISLPSVEEIEDNFLSNNIWLSKAQFPKVKKIGDNFFSRNKAIKELDLPELETVGASFLCNCSGIEYASMPKLRIALDTFMYCAVSLKEINIQEIRELGSFALREARNLKSFEAPKLETIGGFVLGTNQHIKKLYLPCVKTIGNGFLTYDSELEEVYMPNVIKVGEHFLSYSKRCIELSKEIRNQIEKRKNNDIKPNNDRKNSQDNASIRR